MQELDLERACADRLAWLDDLRCAHEDAALAQFDADRADGQLRGVDLEAQLWQDRQTADAVFMPWVMRCR